MSMPGAPANMPAQTLQRCLAKKDLEGNKAYQMPQGQAATARSKDLVESARQILIQDGLHQAAKNGWRRTGHRYATGMNMDMTMTMDGMAGTMTQSITAARLGDCK